MRAAARGRGIAVSIVATVMIFGSVAVWTELSDNYLVIGFSEMLVRFREVWLFDRLTSDLLPSVGRMAAGYLLGCALGVALGLGIGLVPTLSALVQPVVSFMRAIPPIALVPPAIIALGIGAPMRIVLIAFVCLWPVVLNTADGASELDDTMLASAAAYGLRGADRLRFVILPAVSPRVFTGMRTSLGFAVLIMVGSEMVASTNGIGSFLIRAQQSYQIADMWAAIILLGLLGWGLNLAFQRIERRVLRWHLRTRENGS